MASSSSRTRSRSPFSHRRPPSPYSSASSTCSSHMNNRLLPRSSSTSASTVYNSAAVSGSRSMATSRTVSDPGLLGGSGNYKPPSPVPYSSDGVISEPMSTATSDRHSISVTVRFRPMSEREYQRGDEIAWYPDAEKMVRNEYNPLTAYAFDKVFGPQATTVEVYDVAAKPVVKAAMEGVNGTVFAYGVTSSGKTHTMHGDQDFPGIIPLAIKDVFSIIQETTGREFLLRVSYLEIYNEVINDLLDPTGQNLRIREDSQGTYVEGIKEEVVLSPGHALSFIEAGEEHRHVGSNNFNLLSSRSHTIFTLMIESSAHGDQYDGNLIDLAGSESSKTETTGLRRKEGSFINKSLLTLGTVIGKLTEGKTTHVPFRDSKLTRLLQSSLSGHGHVSLICTVTPASSSTEETHNTLKFASRAKRIEINASRNKIIDEKSLIKKYQKEISTLRVELEQLRKGVLVGVSHEELLSLRQQLQEGQVKMQSRLEEEEEAKAALMSRIQKLTKLILVSTKSSIPGYIGDVPSHQRSISAGKDDKLESLLLDGDNLASPSSTLSLVSDASSGLKHRRSSSKLKDENSPVGFGAELSQGGMTPDEMDLLVEQVKMLAGEIAFSKSTLKRLVDQSVNDPENSKPQIQSLEREIQEKQTQMRSLEQRITEGGEASIANASLVEMQQKVMRLMTQCNEKNFELEIISADNRILQEQLEKKCTENNELHEKVRLLEQRQSSQKPSPSCSGNAVSEEYVDELKKKVQTQEIENEKLKLEHVQTVEETSGLRVQNQKLAEEASYAKELASAAAIELKNLADEVTKLSLQNAKLEKELVAARDLAAAAQTRNNNSMNSVANRNGTRPGRKARITDSWNLNQEDLKMELQARKQREAVLEATLAEKQCLEEEYRKKAEEAKRREEALENDLANMWVLVAKLKKASGGVLSGPKSHEPPITESTMEDEATDLENESQNNGILKERQVLIAPEEVIVAKAEETPKEEPLVARLKARMQEMKEKEMKSQAAAAANADANSHVCKVCFESPTATILLPCRHFCLCKCCSLACSECPICRTNISDPAERAFTSLQWRQYPLFNAYPLAILIIINARRVARVGDWVLLGRHLICAVKGGAEEGAFKKTVELDRMIDALKDANPRELEKLVVENILAFDEVFWIRLATRSDTCTSDDDKASKDYEELAATVMTIVDCVVNKTREKIETATDVLKGILRPVVEGVEEISWPPRDPQAINQMEKEIIQREKEGQLDEGFLSEVSAQLRQAKEDKDKPGLAAMLQKVLQLYAATILSKRSYAKKGNDVLKAEQFLETLIKAPEEQWNKLFLEGLTIGKGDVTPDELSAVIKKRVERTLIRTEGGSYQQRILIEYLKGIESRANDIMKSLQG
ncbi:hypothetical protein IGI04_038332 [Brassica rapa subsp. trilocularis]|uniref:Kinesin motor domain-containing protein n=1 Tax=Brassica rapa subsp. trilocularis TaxID=1813537 RepID=A0ABQ7LKT5_BRACM|nr:hypothetical protein IGI04_038332 [Brassica rapa subsp. trilocularis]